MFLLFFYKSPLTLAILYLIHLIVYIGLFRKMGIQPGYAAIPFVSEWKMSDVVFKSMRTYYHALLSCCIFVIGGWYAGSDTLSGVVFLVFGILIYAFFLMRLYYAIARSFGKGVPFSIATAILGTIMLCYLGYGKSVFVGGPSKVDNRPKWLRILLNVSVFLLTAAELIVLTAVVGVLAIRQNPPRFMSEIMAKESIENASGITDKGEVVTREMAMGEEAASIEQYRSREYFYPDHSGDETVVVMDYNCATDLESNVGMSSVNTAQIIDASKKGSNMTFVMQVGGAKRLFTDGMKDGTYARYTVCNGKLEKVLDLPDTTCMAEGSSLTDFITWTKENYPADRYMLVLWDHGGGLSGGYAYDQINRRADGGEIMPSSELVEAVKNAGVKFDLIGFDTCLMQDFDVVAGLEPYTDYMLASEETESGYGWNYTVGFSELAQNPGMSTEEFGESMIASFDPYNTQLSQNKEVDTKSTLSLIDMTYVKTASDKLDDFFVRENEAILKDVDSYANISIAASGAYRFVGDEQMDLIDYLSRLKELDYEEAIMKEQEMQDTINSVQSAIVVRNANSAKGINGLAFSFPYAMLIQYDGVHKQLAAMKMDSQRSMYDNYFSIMAAQQMKSVDGDQFLSILVPDYTKEEWYIKGFEDYDTADAFIDIPLKDTGNGYKVELPEKAWNTITDVQVVAYKHTDDGLLYLGSDHIGSEDEDGRPLIGMDNTWLHVGDSLICYEASAPRETEMGTVFSGKSRARLNGRTNVIVYIETDPVPENADSTVEAHVVGYEVEYDPLSFAKKGLETFNAGDTIEFLFNYYDEEGKIAMKDVPYGRQVRVFSNKPLLVKDEPLGECDIRFGGKLTDIYERTILTETMEVHIDK